MNCDGKRFVPSNSDSATTNPMLHIPPEALALLWLLPAVLSGALVLVGIGVLIGIAVAR